MTKLLPGLFFNSPGGSGVSLKRRFLLYSSSAMKPILRGYNTWMGRMRIKKKDAVIPFRETLAYRMILAGTSLLAFLIALYILVGAVSTNITLAIVSGAIGVAAAFGIFYNLDHLRDAKVPKRTLNRMKRR